MRLRLPGTIELPIGVLAGVSTRDLCDKALAERLGVAVADQLANRE